MTYYLEHPDGTVWRIDTRRRHSLIESFKGDFQAEYSGRQFASRTLQEKHAEELRSNGYCDKYPLVKLDLDGNALCIKPLNFEDLMQTPAMFIELSSEMINELRELGDFPESEIFEERRCRVCGCTETQACVDEETGEMCHWVEEDLCSACADKQGPMRMLPLTDGQWALLAYLWREHARSDLDLDDNSMYLARRLGEGAVFEDLEAPIVVDDRPAERRDGP